MRKPGRGFAKTRPVIMGRNKFTDSKSPSISPGRKVAGLRSISKSPKRHKSYSSYRGRGQGSYRGSSYRGRGSWKSSKGYRPHRSRSRSRGRSRSKSRSHRSRERRSRSPHNRGGHLKDRDHKTPNPKDDDKQKNKGKFDSEKFDELEDFYHKLKENKKKQTETK